MEEMTKAKIRAIIQAIDDDAPYPDDNEDRDCWFQARGRVDGAAFAIEKLENLLKELS